MAENLARLGRLDVGEKAARWLEKSKIKAVYVYEIPMAMQFRGITSRDGVILQGETGLAEAAPFWNYPPEVALRWFQGAVDVAVAGLPATPAPTSLNVTVPITDPETAARLVGESGCLSAKVKVADPRAELEEDALRLRAVRRELGVSAKIRIDANAAWSYVEACEALPRLEEASGGLEYAEQPCRDLRDLAALQASGTVPIAADESIRLAAAPEEALREAIAAGLAAMVVKAMPLGGPTRVRNLVSESRASPTGDLPMGTGQNGKFSQPASKLQNAPVDHLLSNATENHAPLIVVSSALDSGVGLLAGMSLAAALQVDTACGLGTSRLMRGGILTEEPRVDGGSLVPPSSCELNLGLPEPPAELVKRWRARMEDIAACAASAC